MRCIADGTKGLTFRDHDLLQEGRPICPPQIQPLAEPRYKPTHPSCVGFRTRTCLRRKCLSKQQIWDSTAETMILSTDIHIDLWFEHV
jgi:hypothetical protein